MPSQKNLNKTISPDTIDGIMNRAMDELDRLSASMLIKVESKTDDVSDRKPKSVSFAASEVPEGDTSGGAPPADWKSASGLDHPVTPRQSSRTRGGPPLSASPSFGIDHEASDK